MWGSSTIGPSGHLGAQEPHAMWVLTSAVLWPGLQSLSLAWFAARGGGTWSLKALGTHVVAPAISEEWIPFWFQFRKASWEGVWLDLCQVFILWPGAGSYENMATLVPSEIFTSFLLWAQFYLTASSL